MGRDADSARTWETDEEPLAEAARIACALGDLVRRAGAAAPTAQRSEIRYAEALARTLADCLVALRVRGAPS